MREREWEASHTIWLWPDRSPSMVFASALGSESKLDRALVVAFALAEVLVQGGERVGIPGLMRPTASRNIIEKMAETIVHDAAERAEPAADFRAVAALRGRACCPICGARSPRCGATIAHLRQRRARPCRADRRSGRGDASPIPAASSSSSRKAPAAITAGRAETWRNDYQALRRHHRAAIRAETERLGWSFTIHRTDRPATELLLALHARMGAGAHAARVASRQRADAARERRMIAGLPLAFAQPLVLLGLLSLPVLWWLLRLVPPRPRRINFPPTRLLFEIAPKEETPSRTPWWLTLLRLTLAALVIIAAAGPLWNPPLRRRRPRRAAADPDRRRLGRRRRPGTTRLRTADETDRARRSRRPRRRAAAAVGNRRATFRCRSPAPRACSSSSSSRSRTRSTAPRRCR